MTKNRHFLFALIFLISINKIHGQSPCHLVKLSAIEGERIRVSSPSYETLSDDGNPLTRTITVLNRTPETFEPREIKIEIKTFDSGKFRPVRLKIPKPYGCHLLLVRDLALRSPLYFRAEWLSQEMMDEYLFGQPYHGFDTTLFSKEYHNAVTPPAIDIFHKGERLTAEYLQRFKPFNGQNMELDLTIDAPKSTNYQAQLKAMEISFFHPNLTDLESKYIISASYSLHWPQHDSRFYWPDDFTMIPGAKITFKCLYWYKDGQEIKASGRVTQVIEF